jgi:hypothetical protein
MFTDVSKCAEMYDRIFLERPTQTSLQSYTNKTTQENKDPECYTRTVSEISREAIGA